MENRAPRHEERKFGELAGWEPTETLFCEMTAHAGFKDPRLVSTSPHPGESPGNVCGNRSYFIADAGETRPLPFIDAGSSEIQGSAGNKRRKPWTQPNHSLSQWVEERRSAGTRTYNQWINSPAHTVRPVPVGGVQYGSVYEF
jgi:hypothetical protein